MKTIASFRSSALALAAGLALASVAVPNAAHAELSGNIGVVSDYVLRGNTVGPEDNNPALQGGFDWSHGSGFYAGYWGSSLGYGDEKTTLGFENDFYAGWSGEFGPVSVSAGLTYYYYLNVDDSDAFETALSVGVGPVTLSAKTLLEDVAWGNTGDTYLTLSYSQDLPSDFKFTALAGFYYYEDSGDFEDNLNTTEDFNFRHLDLTLSHPIGDTGADMSITAVIGGKTRSDTDLENAIVFGISYGFDI